MSSHPTRHALAQSHEHLRALCLRVKKPRSIWTRFPCNGWDRCHAHETDRCDSHRQSGKQCYNRTTLQQQQVHQRKEILPRMLPTARTARPTTAATSVSVSVTKRSPQRLVYLEQKVPVDQQTGGTALRRESQTMQANAKARALQSVLRAKTYLRKRQAPPYIRHSRPTTPVNKSAIRALARNGYYDRTTHAGARLPESKRAWQSKRQSARANAGDATRNPCHMWRRMASEHDNEVLHAYVAAAHPHKRPQTRRVQGDHRNRAFPPHPQSAGACHCNTQGDAAQWRLARRQTSL